MANEAKLRRETYSSPASRRAHADVESVASERDDLRALYEPQDGRTRAEHAGFLHHTNQSARDLYERGASIYGDTLVIPREASGSAQGADTIRIGTHEHAVKNFSRFVPDPRELGEKATEFVELGKRIAGRTADRHTRLVVFRTYYDRITKNETGKFISAQEQRTSLNGVLEEMRVLALAMRAEEWTNDKRLEFLEVSAWEENLAAQEHGTDHEIHDGLTAHLTGETDEEHYREHDGEERFQSFVMTGEHDSLRLDDLPPRLPGSISKEDFERLRREVLPRLDRQIEMGVPPRNIIATLERERREEETRERDSTATRLLHAPDAGDEHTVTRQEQLRAFYTLRTLAEVARQKEEGKVDSRKNVELVENLSHSLAVIDAEIERLGFTGSERARALESVGRSGAREYRAETNRLASYESSEKQATEETQKHRQHFLIHFGMMPENAREARGQVQPYLTSLRSNLLLVKAERDSVAGVKTLDAERNPVRSDAPPRASLFVAISSNQSNRLPIESFNEYKVLTSTATKAHLPLLVFRGLYREEVTGRSPERNELYSFQKEYVQYRMRDTETRQLNENALYRDFNHRLNSARDIEELRRVANDIRRENYAREHRPETYAHERETKDKYAGGAKRPLTESEMRGLFLAPSPQHYTDEMRRYRYDKGMSRAERERTIEQLERGAINPSPALRTLLSEFARTEARDRKQHLRNVNLFIAELINPPREGATRVSRVDVYRIHEQLSTTERNYLFRTINGEKDSLKNALDTRDRNRLGQILDGDIRGRDEQLKPLRLPTESASFRRYTGAVAWREAELLTEAAARAKSPESRQLKNQTRQAIPHIVSERNLETVVTLLRDFEPDQAMYAAEHLRASGDLEGQRAGEILTTFKDMKRTVNERGQQQFQITIPEDSTIPRESWRQLFDRVQPQLTGQRAALLNEIPKALANEIRRTAITDGWKAFDSVGLSEAQALLNEPTLEKAVANLRQQVETAATLQRRLAVAHAAQTDAQSSPDKSSSKLAEIRAYNHQVKENFLSSFALIDEAQKDFIHTRITIVKDHEERQAQERVKPFTDARPELQQRVSEYLKMVLREHGERAFENGRGGTHHAAMVGAIIKDGLKERGIRLSAVNLDDERVDRVAQEIVRNLPRDLRTARERNAVFDREQMIELNGFDHADEREHQALLSSPHNVRERDLQESRVAREPKHSKRSLQAVEIAESFDDEFVEQKVASHLGRTHPVQPRHFNRPIHDHSNQQAQTHETTQHKERVMQLTLSR
jgi:hypothetical protein